MSDLSDEYLVEWLRAWTAGKDNNYYDRLRLIAERFNSTLSRLDQSEHERALDAKLLDNVRGNWEHRVKELESRLGDCELSLSVFDPGGASEYWLRHQDSCRREAAPTPAPLLDGLSPQGEPSNPSLGVDGAVRESPDQTARVVERPAYVETQCSIREYDGAYKCFTHNRMWGAVTNPQTPCVGWKSSRREHVHDFRPSELIPGEHVCSCGKYYAVETPFPPDHQRLDTQGDCPCAVCRPSRDVEIPEHFVTCPHCKTRFSGVGDYMSDFNRHIQECSGKKVERRGSIHPADCVLSCKGCGAAPGEAHAVGCEFE